MKREFDVKLTCNEIEILEKLLRDELEFQIYTDKNTYNRDTVIEVLDLFRKFFDASNDMIDEAIEEARRQTGKDWECWDIKRLHNDEYVAIGSGKCEVINDECCEENDCECYCADQDECTCFDSDYILNHVFNENGRDYSVGSFVITNYDHGEFAEGKWIEFDRGAVAAVTGDETLRVYKRIE